MISRLPAASFRAVALASAVTIPLLPIMRLPLKAQPTDPKSSQSGAQPGLPPGSPPSAQPGTADAIRVLFDQATFWRSQYQPQKADEALARVLALDPRNADALALQAQGAADSGNTDAAQAALAKLRNVRPDDPRIATIEQVLHAGPPDMALVNEARRLSKDNKPAEAIETFRKAFHGGNPPPALATEYYQMLSGTDGGWEPARAGLVSLIKSNPDDLRNQLAYAELLTYRDETRDEGLDRLTKLMAFPAISRQADISYRKALFWLPSNPDSVPHYDIYLSRHPGDTEIANRETQAKNDLNSVRLAGYADLQNGDAKAAEAQFNRALVANPDDSDALLGLALTRFRQRREAEGRTLIRRVIEIDPTKKDEFEKFLVEPPVQQAVRRGQGGVDPRIAARLRGQYQQVARLTQQGDFKAAEATLRRLMGPRPNAGNLVELAGIQAAAGETEAAAATYHQVLARSPRNAAALAGLGQVLTQTGHFAEAEGMFAQISGRANTAEVGRLRGEAYRLEAGNAADTTQRMELLRQAVGADPANPWIRLELARLLLNQGQASGGQQVMAAITHGPRPTSQQLLAGIYYANDTDNLDEAAALVARLPDHDRGPDMRTIQVRAQVASELREARSLGSRTAIRERLFQLASAPDPSGLRVTAFAQELSRHGDKPGARELVRIALGARAPTPAQRIAYSGVLVGAGYGRDARLVANRLEGVPLTPVQTSSLSSVNDTIAVSNADQLNGDGKPDQAYSELQPRLTANPESLDLNMALARVYEARQQPDRALAINEDLLQRNPDNLDIRRSTLGAALAAGNYRRAAALATETRTMFPDDPQTWVMSADVARARGRNGEALQELRTARNLRLEQLKSGAASPDGAASASNAAAPVRKTSSAAERAGWQRYAEYLPANTASDVPTMYAQADTLPIEAPDAATDTSPDPFTRDYVRYTPPPGINPAPRRAEPPAAATAAADPPTPPALPPLAPLNVPPSLGERAPSASQPDVAPAQQADASQPGVTAEYLPPGPQPFYNRFAQATQDRSAQANQDGIPQATQDRFAQATQDRFAQATRGSPLPTQDEPNGAPSALIPPPPANEEPAPDPMLREIDRNISQVAQTIAPQANGSLSLRGRSGATGLERLFEVAAPLEATYSPGEGIYGRLKVQVTPTYLYSGSIDGQGLQRFGTNPLVPFGSSGLQNLQAARRQQVYGTALDVGYSYADVSGDVGVSPIGFEKRSFIGGIEYAPSLTNRLTLRLVADRRSVTDSLLSFAGTSDPRTGIQWGGVTRNHGHAQLEGGIGQTNFYAGAGYAVLLGSNVAYNSEIDAGMGFSTPVYTDRTRQVRLGVDLVYFGFDRNVSGFTVGQGGYYSPQMFIAALLPVNFRHQVTDDIVYNIGGSVGFQTYRESATDVFPGQSPLQSQLATLAATQTGLNLRNNGAHSNGFTGGGHADIDYRVTENLHIGAKAGYDHAGPFSEGTGLIYARYVFNDPALTQ